MGFVHPNPRPRLYLEAPFLVDGRQEHARVALFAVDADAGTLPQHTAGPSLSPGGSSFDVADGVLESLAGDVAPAILSG